MVARASPAIATSLIGATHMKKLLIAVIGAFALSLAGATYAQTEAPKGDSKPAQEMPKEQAKPKAKKAGKKKCAAGEVYSKKDKKCVPKT
jgi:hypothetical protein